MTCSKGWIRRSEQKREVRKEFQFCSLPKVSESSLFSYSFRNQSKKSSTNGSMLTNTGRCKARETHDRKSLTI